MVLKVAKLMDEGTRNPTVTRLSIGISDLLPFTTLSKAESERVFACAMEVMPLVVQAQKTAGLVVDELASIEQRLKAEGIDESGTSISVPSAMGLHHAATFLVQAKKALQVAIKVLELFWGKKFGAAHFHKARDWALAQLGEGHPLSKMLVEDQPWIANLIALRNEEEHPTSGKPFTSNYEISEKQQDGKFHVTRPKFFDGSDVGSVLTTYAVDLMTFIEELFILGISEKLRPGIALVEVPEHQRRQELPVRFVVALKAPRFQGGNRRRCLGRAARERSGVGRDRGDREHRAEPPQSGGEHGAG